ncbi:hypothetical protein M758_1G236000 [Ceratodon purpureus]|nr:hypothetical protein M758_1G236000 [Ceratodon purpureus]
MSSSGVSFFRKGESIAKRMWDARKPEVPLSTREHNTTEDSRQETLPLNAPSPETKLDHSHIIVESKPQPRLLRSSTHTNLLSTSINRLSTYTDYFTAHCCFICIRRTLFLAITATITLYLCVALGYRQPYTNLQSVTLRNFNLSQTLNSSWQLSSNLVITFQAGNPSNLPGFTTRFLHTEVNASYHTTPLGNSSIPYFSQGRHSKRNLTTEVMKTSIDELDQSSALALQAEIQSNSDVVGVRIDVNAYTKQSYLIAWTLNKWFNLTCLVDVTMPSASEPGHLVRQSCDLRISEPMLEGSVCELVPCTPDD